MDGKLKDALDTLSSGLGLKAILPTVPTAHQGEPLLVRSPIDGSVLAEIPTAAADFVGPVIRQAADAFPAWRDTPAPARGEFVRRIGQRLREHQEGLAAIVAWETGKILPEARGEVQEMIDICDFAVGLSRQLYGKTIASE